MKNTVNIFTGYIDKEWANLEETIKNCPYDLHEGDFIATEKLGQRKITTVLKLW